MSYLKKYLKQKKNTHEQMTGERMEKQARKMQFAQYVKEKRQQKEEEKRLAEATSDVERRKAKMMRARQYGRGSLLGG